MADKMSKKLRQAVQYANETDTTKGVGNPPNTSKKAKQGFMQTHNQNNQSDGGY
ncbi:hypothetical protein [Fredinandcohnia sp. 179-A 10B2 NHS]|uniref:hypothetical protein n=1 Tax=Fredinandcohnia sp. 179-A 10B2 NHS TaxID=3235176 RepID=UPI0039A1AE4B